MAQRRLRRCIGIALALAISGIAAPTRADEGGGQAIVSGTRYDLTSHTGGVYRIDISVPDGPAPQRGFPVFYLLDGNLQFPIATAIATLRAVQSGLPRAVVVGIGYPENTGADIRRRRAEDLTLPILPADVPPQLKTPGGRFGEADRFLRFLADEVMPFVARKAAIDRNCQTLFGHSLGGLFVLHALFTRPALFRSYVAASPSIFWANKAVLKDEATFSAAVDQQRAQARLLILAGEPEPLTPEAVALAERLTQRRSPGFTVESYVFPGDNHVAVIPGSINRGIAFGLDCPK